MAGIRYLADHRTWVLTGESSTYALRLDEDDVPAHVFWGPKLPPEDVAELSGKALPWWDGFNDPNEGLDELAADGGTKLLDPRPSTPLRRRHPRPRMALRDPRDRRGTT